MRIVALCADCHEVTHMGLAQVRGKRNFALKHFMNVRNCNSDVAERHIKEAFDVWEQLNQFDWELDLSIITNAGLTLLNKVETKNRKIIAEEILIERQKEELNLSNIVAEEDEKFSIEKVFITTYSDNKRQVRKKNFISAITEMIKSVFKFFLKSRGYDKKQVI